MKRSTVRVELNRDGVRDLLKSPGVEADLAARAKEIAAAAGPGHVVETDVEGGRAAAAVIAVTAAANLREQRDRTLTRAIDAGR